MQRSLYDLVYTLPVFLAQLRTGLGSIWPRQYNLNYLQDVGQHGDGRLMLPSFLEPRSKLDWKSLPSTFLLCFNFPRGRASTESDVSELLGPTIDQRNSQTGKRDEQRIAAVFRLAHLLIGKTLNQQVL